MKDRDVRAFDYVNHPYESVRDALRSDPLGIFRSGTMAAASRAHEVASALRVNVGGVEIGTEIAISIVKMEEDTEDIRSNRGLHIHLEWEAAGKTRLFPIMMGELAVYPLSGTETQLDFTGHYRVPLGLVGQAVDKAVGYRIADASVHRFMADVADYLRTELPD